MLPMSEQGRLEISNNRAVALPDGFVRMIVTSGKPL